MGEARSIIEDDSQLFERVTEALRAGPGTSAWEEALRALGAAGGDAQAEAELLARVRRHLESGHSWREIGAGEKFTSKLMRQLDEPVKPAGPSITAWIAGLAVFTVVGLGVWGVVSAMRSSGSGNTGEVNVTGGGSGVGGRPAMPDVLAFTSPKVVWDFGSPWPGRTKLVGKLPLQASGDGLRPVIGKLSGGQSEATAAFLEVPLQASEPVVVEVTWEMPVLDRLSPGLVAQLFLTNTTTLDGVTTLTETEWVWQADKTGVRVITPKLEVASLPALARDGDGRVTLRIILAGERASVESGGQTVWTGDVGVGAQGARFVGVRFLGKDEVVGPVPTVKMIRVLGGRG